jgi:internalin A
MKDNLVGLDSSGYEEALREIEEAQATGVAFLDLSGLFLKRLPPTIGNLQNLTYLDLSDNELQVLPRQIGRLKKLATLRIDGNDLRELPKEIGRLGNLLELGLSDNELTHLPYELCQLGHLEELDVSNNPLISPPPEITRQGTIAILNYLFEKANSPERQWISKLIVVGEGGVGKTSMIRRLMGEQFREGENTTHGIAIRKIEMHHPIDAVPMLLNAWDFGGQEIYHATHQFFLTNRSLFLLVWNARLGYDQGRLYYWLDIINSLAPQSPILIVATHTDERAANLPYSDLVERYPSIVGQLDVSNKTGTGITTLAEKIAYEASKLPLMGETWPSQWLKAANHIRQLNQKHISARQLWGIMSQYSLSSNAATVLANWLHELGDILYFGEDEELMDTVILKPQWVSNSISKVLENENVMRNLGIFTREQMSELWEDVDQSLHETFLRLMEKFDLSYRIPEDPKNRSLVVERLALEEPRSKWEDAWNNISNKGISREIKIKYVLKSTMPAGIPTWFIARSHRFSTDIHWRYGALLADTKEMKHVGLVRAYPHDRYVELTVKGPNPQPFFAVLRDGLELTFGRFPGLLIDKCIPCPGHRGVGCSHEFLLDSLIARIARDNPKYTIECPLTFEDIDVRQLLFGLEPIMNDQVMLEVQKALTNDKNRQDELIQMVQMQFAKEDLRWQSTAEAHCPRVFTLSPSKTKKWSPTNLLTQPMDLQLYCEATGRWHKVKSEDGGRYKINQPAKWLRQITPHIKNVVKILKFVSPLASNTLDAATGNTELGEVMDDIKLTEALIDKLPELSHQQLSLFAEEVGETTNITQTSGATLRAIRRLLDELDSSQHWGGLEKVHTPEGHILWLCNEHATEYKR